MLGLLAVLAPASRAGAIPSAVISYAPTPPPAVDQYAAPGNVIVVPTNVRDSDPSRIRAWRAKGAIVLAYVGAVDWLPAPQTRLERRLYGGTGSGFPSQWLYRGLYEYPGTKLLDLTASCPVATFNGFTGTWGEYVAHFIRTEVIGDGTLFDGVFLDVWGAQLWSGSAAGIGGPGSAWEAGVAKWSGLIRQLVGPDVFLVGNSTQTVATAPSLSGRMYESFDSSGSGWNQLTGGGPYPGIVPIMSWTWNEPRLMILWRNEASPSQATKDMLLSAAQQATRTGTDIAVGASDLGSGIPAPFGTGGGKAPPSPVVPPYPLPGSGGGPGPGGAPPVEGAPGAGRPGALGAGSSSPAVRRLVLLLRSSFARRILHPWSALVGPGAARLRFSGSAGRAVVRLVEPGLRGGHAALRGTIRPARHVRLASDLRIVRLQVPRGGSRALLSVSASQAGRSIRAGLVRTASGTLRWAVWRSGARPHLSYSRLPAAALRGWLHLELRTDWDRTGARPVLLVGSRRAVVGRGEDLRGSRAIQVSVGLGSTRGATGGATLLVRRIGVVGLPA